MKAIYNYLLAVIVLLITQISFAQVQSVSGVVTDQSGVPIPGVNVLVKNNKTGTQTDLEGKFKISAKTGEVLLFSFLGMSEYTIKVGLTSSTINVKMLEGAKKLEDVVIQGYGKTATKASTIGATQTISS